MKLIKRPMKWILTVTLLCSSIELWPMYDLASIAGGIYLVDEMMYGIKNYNMQKIPLSEKLNEIPTDKERAEFLGSIFEDRELYPDIKIPVIVRLTQNDSYGKLEKIIEEARSLALKDGANFIAMKHMDAARLNVNKGLQRRESVFGWIGENIAGRRSVAIHEAGHAVSAAYQLHNTVIHHATVKPRGNTGGFVLPLGINGGATINYGSVIDRRKHTIYNGEMDIITALCGGVAQQVFGLFYLFPQDILTDKHKILKFISQSGMSPDMKIARAKAESVVYQIRFLAQETGILSKEAEALDDFEIKEEVNNILVRLYPVAYQFIVEHKDQVEKVADLLQEKGSVSGDEIYDVLKIDKPLYDFESGPLPQRLVGNYQYRGNHNKHEKDVAASDYNKYRAQFLQQKPARGTVSLGSVSQDLYEKVGELLAASPPSQSFNDSDQIRDSYGRLFEVD